jgi:hypothetical protein
MAVFVFYEKRIINILKKMDPESLREYTYFFGQKLRFQKLKTSIRDEKFTDIDLLNYFNILKKVVLLIWFFFAAFLVFMGASNV